ncbi:NUDIX hydrolase domain-like protein [Diaporthe sp. PMI_573]|nr:NUDIX hydrolase domain-like protein [Diaporthaceae sp. PMI_573]
MSVPKANTITRLKYGKKARMGTMGILRKEGKVLLIHRRLKNKTTKIDGPPDTWSFPGGGADEDETPEETIMREMEEEVGLKVVIKPIGDETVWGETDDFLKNDQWRCFFFVLEQVDPEQEPEIMEPRKHVGLRWIEWNELWARIEAEMANDVDVDDTDDTEKDTSGEEKMRFFPSMKNMVQRYPKRSDAACLEKRL